MVYVIDSFKVLRDETFEAELKGVETALVFFTERDIIWHQGANAEVVQLFRNRAECFMAYMSDSLLLCREYGVTVINSYCLIRRGRLLDSYVPMGHFDAVTLAVWCDDVLNDRPRKSRYSRHITSLPASAMIAYLREMEKEEKANTARVRSVLLELERSLGGTEQEVHTILWANAFLLDLFYEGGYIVSKLPLGNKYVTDFVVFGYRNWTNDVGIHATFIEIEKPTGRLFTKAGDPAACLTHALRQVQDWKAWLSRNSNYFQRTARSLMSGHESKPTKIKSTRSLGGFYRDVIDSVMDSHVSYSFTVIAGRRGHMTLADRIRLDEMNSSLNGIRVMTYDALVEGWMKRLGSVV